MLAFVGRLGVEGRVQIRWPAEAIEGEAYTRRRFVVF